MPQVMSSQNNMPGFIEVTVLSIGQTIQTSIAIGPATPSQTSSVLLSESC